MPRAWNGAKHESGIVDDPVFTSRRLERSVRSQSGCEYTACSVAGTSSVSVGRRAATSRRNAPGSKRAWIVTVAPACSAGSVWMHRPPTWNIGSTVSTWSRLVRSWQTVAFTMFQSRPA